MRRASRGSGAFGGEQVGGAGAEEGVGGEGAGEGRGADVVGREGVAVAEDEGEGGPADPGVGVADGGGLRVGGFGGVARLARA